MLVLSVASPFKPLLPGFIFLPALGGSTSQLIWNELRNGTGIFLLEESKTVKSPRYNLGCFLARESPAKGTNVALKMKPLQDSLGFDFSGAVGLL